MSGLTPDILFISLICFLIVSKSPLSIGPDKALAGLVIFIFLSVEEYNGSKISLKEIPFNPKSSNNC